jgi:hypothetical protein
LQGIHPGYHRKSVGLISSDPASYAGQVSVYTCLYVIFRRACGLSTVYASYV